MNTDPIVELAEELAHPAFPRSWLEDMRRWGPTDPPLVYVMGMADYGKIEADTESELERWSLVCHGIAVMTKNRGENRSAHDPAKRFGRALRGGGPNSLAISEIRFRQLMNARDRALFRELHRVFRSLAKKGIAVDWREVGELILAEDALTRSAIRERISAAYNLR